MDVIGSQPDASAPRSVAAERGVSWITDAWPLFKDQAGLWVLLTVIGGGIALVCSLIPLLGSLATPFVSTLVAAGMMGVAKKQRTGGVPEVGDLFAILSHPALTRLLIVALIYLALSVGALLVILLAFGMGGGIMAAFSGVVAGDTAAIAALGGSLMLGALVYLALLVPIIAMYWYAVPLILFRNAEPWPAMMTSLKGCLANIVPMLVYGVVALLMCVLGAIPLMLGLLVVMPLLLISWLISFEEIFP